MENGDRKFNIWEPMTAPIGEPYPFEVFEEYEDVSEENLDKSFIIEFLKSKIIQLFLHFDPMNFERNWKNLKDELKQTLENHKINTEILKAFELF